MIPRLGYKFGGMIPRSPIAGCMRPVYNVGGNASVAASDSSLLKLTYTTRTRLVPEYFRKKNKDLE